MVMVSYGGGEVEQLRTAADGVTREVYVHASGHVAGEWAVEGNIVDLE